MKQREREKECFDDSMVFGASTNTIILIADLFFDVGKAI